MKNQRPPLAVLAVIGAVLCFGGVLGSRAADSLVWHRQQDKVDADIRTWNVPQLLEHVAAATGWQVYLDPGASRAVSAKFSALPSNEALRALLGDLNFLIVSQTNGAPSLYVFRTSRTQATRLIVAAPKGPAQPIPNQWVVVMKPGSKGKIDELARALGAKIIGRMDSQNAYLLEFGTDAATQAAHDQLLDNPDVAAVDYNYPVDSPPMPLSSQAGAANLQLKPKADNGNNCPLVIGLVDTPVQPLAANLAAFLDPAIQVAGGPPVPATELTHGTAMAETILRAVQAKTGGSTSVKILPVNVFGNSETTSTFDIANGVVQAINNGASILNLSLGSTGNSQVLQNVIAQAVQQGIPIFAAAGNEPVTTPTYPAAYPGVTAVTASDSSGGIASYANRGSFVKMIAPGDNVVSYDGQNYLVEGTSTSTALVSGMAAGLADSAHQCPDQVQSLLKQNATSVPAPKP
jgi:hypothetical protein